MKKKEDKMNTIRIHIIGGLAEVIEKPKGVELIIRDYDVENETDITDEDETGKYAEAIYEEGEEV